MVELMQRLHYSPPLSQSIAVGTSVAGALATITVTNIAVTETTSKLSTVMLKRI